MIEAIAHLINRDYDLIGEDFVNLDFIPKVSKNKNKNENEKMRGGDLELKC